MTETVREMLEKIKAEVEGTVSARQDALSQATALLANAVGPLATAHRLAELSTEMFDLANHGVSAVDT
jgi:hypothetical protein